MTDKTDIEQRLDCALDELREIRAIIQADKEESTMDEVHRVFAELERTKELLRKRDNMLQFHLGWQPLDSAPRDETRFDVIAKCWLAVDDSFIYRRFTDCYFTRPHDSAFDTDKRVLSGVDEKWSPTHWMPLPQFPNAQQAASLQRVWIRANKDWAEASGQYTITNDIRTLSAPADPTQWIEFIEVRKG